MSEGDQQQQQQSPTQGLENSLVRIRKVQNMIEISYPQRGDAIKLLREAGDLVWAEIEEKKKQMQQEQAQDS